MTEFEQICRKNRSRIRRLSLDLQYQQTIEYDGRVFYYDPDYDCFYPYVDPSTLSYWDRWGWIWVTIALAIVAYFVS
jgi:hypothetical protein